MQDFAEAKKVKVQEQARIELSSSPIAPSLERSNTCLSSSIPHYAPITELPSTGKTASRYYEFSAPERHPVRHPMAPPLPKICLH